ncbi:pilus assembly protein TadG-related protein [Nitrospira sp. NS4]|uniref:pilus assembly protein TadG-related protein n=1 Tax=Nitrospira sp. NS4 TaxID=3414498 RepID=UPI003C30311B
MSKARLAQRIGQAICRQPVIHDTRGAVAVTVAIVMVVLFSFAALALDISNAMIARNELQNVADASALAGARQLGVIYQALPAGTPYTTYQLSDASAVVNAATTVASQNQARGVAISLNPADIVIGVWNSGPRTLTPGNVGATGVRVTARRDGGANGPVATWLAGIMGINSMNVVATATAALTGTGTLLPGEANAPFGLDQLIFDNPAYCNTPIQFYPTNNPPSGCAGWNTFLENPPNANTERQIVQGLTPSPPTYVTPQISSGVTSLEYIGGNVASAFPSLINLYLAKRVPAASPSGYCWNVTVPVYANQNCTNPGGPLMTIGFASACVWNVQGVPTQQIDATITCGEVTNGAGGGGNFGTLGSIPGLVE